MTLLRAANALALAAVLLALAAAPASAAPGPVTSPAEARELAAQHPEVRRARAEHGELQVTADRSGGRWIVTHRAGGEKEVELQLDAASGRVLEAWTGIQASWPMARGRDGEFGRAANAPWVWLPLGVAFLLPFVDVRRPFRLLHLDLAVLLAFGVSHWFFNRGEIGWSVPLAYPVLAYLLARMLFVAFRPRPGSGALVPHLPAGALGLGLVFLVAFRVVLNLTDANVVDVGYASVIGADRLADGDPLYGPGFSEDVPSGDTYGPLAYLAYLPFEQLLPWSGAWDRVWAAHAAALCFDLATLAALVVLGRRLRPGEAGRRLGLALAFAWAAYPYSLFALSNNANDGLVGLLGVLALLAAGSPAARGAVVGLAASVKFAPLAMLALFARGTDRRPAYRRMLVAVAVALAVAALLFVAVLAPAEVDTVWQRTLGFQAGRESPFSLWGLWPALAPLQAAVALGATALALLSAWRPRDRTPVQVAALAAAILLAVQIAAGHWFYLYIVWWAPLCLVALLGAGAVAPSRQPSPPAPADGRETAGAPIAPQPPAVRSAT